MVAVVIEPEFPGSRWLVCRRTVHGWTTVESDHCDGVSAERERKKLQAQFDRAVCSAPFDPDRPQQMVLGFYTDEDAA